MAATERGTVRRRHGMTSMLEGLVVRSALVAALLSAASCATVAPPTPSEGLAGTSWQLVKFQGGDGRVQAPVQPSQYTMAFNADGSLVARIDCNRGRGTWRSSGPGQLELGPMATTRAACPPGSMHDRVIQQLPQIRSYVIRDGHLFLSLMTDGGIYEFEPAR